MAVTKARASAPKVDLPTIRQGRVGEIPALWVPQPGPVMAMLRFRVGTADETMLTHGITHLVEHLTLSTITRNADLDFNGWVTPNTTTFVAGGERADTQRFIAGVCEALQSLPVDRLAEEINILRTEGAQRVTGVVEKAMARRFGAVGYGLGWFEELGFDTVTAEDVKRWAETNFTAANAVIVLTGAPRGFRAELPAGERHAVPEAVSVIEGSGWMWSGDETNVGVSWLSERTPASGAFGRAFERRLTERLRHDRSLAYSVGSAFERTGQWTHGIAGSQVLQGSAQAAVDETRAILDELAAQPVTKKELADERRKMQRSLAAAGGTTAGGWLDRSADELLFNDQLTQPADVIAQIEAVTADEVEACAQDALRSVILLLPTGTQAPGLNEASASAPTAPIVDIRFKARTKRSADSKNVQRLAVGAEGVTWSDKDETMTYRWSEMTAWARYTDGGRMYILRNGCTLTVDPKIWSSSDRLVGILDETAPKHLRIDFDNTLSAPPPTPAAAAPAGLSVIGMVIVMTLIAVLFGATTISLIVDTVKVPSSDNFFSVLLSLALTFFPAKYVWNRLPSLRGS